MHVVETASGVALSEAQSFEFQATWKLCRTFLLPRMKGLKGNLAHGDEALIFSMMFKGQPFEFVKHRYNSTGGAIVVLQAG